MRTIKTLAVALPLATMAPKASAQATRITEGAQKVLTGAAKDSLKTISHDPRTVSLSQYNGFYKGTVVNGKIGNGNLQYAEKGKTTLYEFPTKTTFKADAAFIKADNLPAPGFKIHGNAARGKDEYDVAFAYASKNGYSDMIANVAYTRNFPLGSGFTAYGKGGVNNLIRREAVKGGDHHGIVTPHLDAGIKFDHKFSNDITVGATAEVGGGPSFYLKTDAGKTEVKRNVMYNAEGRVGMKKVEVFGQVGRDDILGNQFGIGTRYKF